MISLKLHFTFIFVKMIVDIMVYTIPESGTLFNFGNFLLGFFLEK